MKTTSICSCRQLQDIPRQESYRSLRASLPEKCSINFQKSRRNFGVENYGAMEAILALLVKVQMLTLFESTSKNKGVKATNCVFLISPRRKAPQLAATGIASEVGLLF